MKPLVLVIFDGFGISFEKKGNPLYEAKMPNLKHISTHYLGTLLRSSGLEVGLSWGEMGSSEVGHANIGAGLVVYQNLEKINLLIEDKSFFKFPIWKKIVGHAEKNNSAIHLMGLVSNGGVHSHSDHVEAILQGLKDAKCKSPVFVHVFTDGQDVAPSSAMKFIEKLEKAMKKYKIGKIATVSGRYYGMDKGEEWERVRRAYECLTEGKGNTAQDIEKAIAESYKKDIKDEELEPTVIVGDDQKPVGIIKENDALIFFNFRADRAREITRVFTSDDFDGFQRKKIKNLYFVSMTQYGIGYPTESIFEPEHIDKPLAKIIADAGKKQLHIAETEKYAHVTYFFNGGVEKEFKGEDRVIIKSKNVERFDQKPEMSAAEITDHIVDVVKKGKYDFIVANFANCDIVAHTGNYTAVVKAIEVLDTSIGEIKKAVVDAGGILVITADHGNAEEMINLETGEIDKEHSTNPVPLWIVSEQTKREIQDEKKDANPEGILADVAPTILELMDIKQPDDMTGTSLLHVINGCVLPD
ncbi:MAG: 2,3-bisphosphoglycerate-independent phosphoglycerate mutase [bacterium]|nr:2,3-bisphosphoglycerate-independent phosphoglycerate mutase [bacterium]